MLNLTDYKKTEYKSYITIENKWRRQIHTALRLGGVNDFKLIRYSHDLDEELKSKFEFDSDVVGDRKRLYSLLILNYSKNDALEIIEKALKDEDAAYKMQSEDAANMKRFQEEMRSLEYETTQTE